MHMRNRIDMQKAGRDGWPAPPGLPALDVLADRLRQRIVWELAHEPRTPTALAQIIGCSQPLVSKHLGILRAAGLVESRRDRRDHRAHVYDIRHDQFERIADWLEDIQRNYLRRHPPSVEPEVYGRPDPYRTTRGTPRKYTLRALKEWQP